MKTAQFLIIVISFISTSSFGQVKQVKVNEAVFHYTDQGSGEPVIFIHGSLSDYRSWDPVLENFSKNFRTISYSRRFNYPNTNTAEVNDFSQDSEAEDLAAFIQELDIAPVHIVGHSFGGMVAISLAKKYPHLVRSLVLSEPPVVEWLKDIPEGESHYENFYNQLLRPVQIAFDLRDTADVLRHTMNYFMGEDMSAKVPPEVKSAMIANFAEWKAIANSKSVLQGITREDVQNLKMPIMLLSAGNTHPSVKLTNAELQRLLPNANHYHIPEAKHDFWYTHLSQVSMEVKNFLKTCSD